MKETIVPTLDYEKSDNIPATLAKITPFEVCVLGNGDIIWREGTTSIKVLRASNQTVSTYLGKGSKTDDGVFRTDVSLSVPTIRAISMTPSGACAFMESFRVRIISKTDETVTTVAGNLTSTIATDGEKATNSKLVSLTCFAFDEYDNLYTCETARIRKVTNTTGIISSVAGTGLTTSTLPTAGSLASTTKIKNPSSVLARSNIIYFTSSNAILKIEGEKLYPLFGGWTTCTFNISQTGPSNTICLNAPKLLDIIDDEIYFRDNNDQVIRKITVTGSIELVAGGGAQSIDVSRNDLSLKNVSLSYKAFTIVKNNGFTEYYISLSSYLLKVDKDRILHTIAGNLGLDLKYSPLTYGMQFSTINRILYLWNGDVIIVGSDKKTLYRLNRKNGMLFFYTKIDFTITDIMIEKNTMTMIYISATDNDPNSPNCFFFKMDLSTKLIERIAGNSTGISFQNDGQSSLATNINGALGFRLLNQAIYFALEYIILELNTTTLQLTRVIGTGCNNFWCVFGLGGSITGARFYQAKTMVFDPISGGLVIRSNGLITYVDENNNLQPLIGLNRESTENTYYPLPAIETDVGYKGIMNYHPYTKTLYFTYGGTGVASTLLELAEGNVRKVFSTGCTSDINGFGISKLNNHTYYSCSGKFYDFNPYTNYTTLISNSNPYQMCLMSDGKTIAYHTGFNTVYKYNIDTASSTVITCNPTVQNIYCSPQNEIYFANKVLDSNNNAMFTISKINVNNIIEPITGYPNITIGDVSGLILNPKTSELLVLASNLLYKLNNRTGTLTLIGGQAENTLIPLRAIGDNTCWGINKQGIFFGEGVNLLPLKKASFLSGVVTTVLGNGTVDNPSAFVSSPGADFLADATKDGSMPVTFTLFYLTKQSQSSYSKKGTLFYSSNDDHFYDLGQLTGINVKQLFLTRDDDIVYSSGNGIYRWIVDCERDRYGFCIRPSPQCFGIHYNNISTCSGNGDCFDTDECECYENYLSKDCSVTWCFGTLSNDSSVCSSHGSCSSYNNCECDSQYAGFDCSEYSCYGVPNIDNSVCNGNGTCLGDDNCVCYQGFSGVTCNESVISNSSNTLMNSTGNDTVIRNTTDPFNNTNFSGSNTTLSNTTNSNSTFLNQTESNSTIFNSTLSSNSSLTNSTQHFNQTNITTDSNNTILSNSTINNSTFSNQTMGDNSISNNTIDTRTNITNITTDSKNITNSSNITPESNNTDPFNNTNFSGSNNTNSNSTFLNQTESNSTIVNNTSTVQNNSSIIGNSSLILNNTKNSTNNNEEITCYGIAISNSTVCSGNGKCEAENYCHCIDQYYGNVCQYKTKDLITCFGKYQWSSDVCFASGTCVSNDTCQCNESYYGSRCASKLVSLPNFNSYYNSIQFYFDNSVSVSDSYLDCKTTLDENSMKLVGDNPSCYIKNGNLNIDLGGQFSLKPYMNISFNVNVFDSTIAKNFLSLTVLPSNNPFKPIVNVSYKKLISSCEAINIDGSGSYCPELKPLKYTWSIESSPDPSLTLDHFIYTNTLNSSIQIPSSPLFGNFIIGLIVESSLSGAKSDKYMVQVIRSSVPTPTVSILNSKQSLQNIEKADLPLVIKKSIEIPSCYYDDIEFDVNWKLLNGSKNISYQVDTNNLIITNFNGDGSYVFSVTVISRFNSNSNSTTIVSISTISLPLLLNSFISSLTTSEAKVDVEYFDPDNDNESVEIWKWTCLDKSTNQPCLDAIYINTLSECSSSKSLQCNLKKSTLDHLTLTLTIQKGVKSVSNSLDLKFPISELTIPPIISLISVFPNRVKVLKDELLSIQLSVTLSGDEKISNDEFLTREWTINNEQLSSSMTSEMMIPTSKSSSLVLSLSDLIEGMDYTINLKVTDTRNSLSSKFSYSFKVARSPKSCSCSINPSSGHALETPFSFSCPGCQNLEQSLDFVFGFIDDKSRTKIPLYNLGEKFSTFFPSPFLGNSLNAFVDIVDTDTGASVEFIKPVGIITPVAKSLTEIRNKVKSWKVYSSSLSSSNTARLVFNSATISRTSELMISALPSIRSLKDAKLNEIYSLREELIDGMVFGLNEGNSLELISDVHFRIYIFGLESIAASSFTIDDLPFDKLFNLTERLIMMATQNTKFTLANGVDILCNSLFDNIIRLLSKGGEKRILFRFRVITALQKFEKLVLRNYFVGQKDYQVAFKYFTSSALLNYKSQQLKKEMTTDGSIIANFENFSNSLSNRVVLSTSMNSLSDYMGVNDFYSNNLATQNEIISDSTSKTRKISYKPLSKIISIDKSYSSDFTLRFIMNSYNLSNLNVEITTSTQTTKEQVIEHVITTIDCVSIEQLFSGIDNNCSLFISIGYQSVKCNCSKSASLIILMEKLEVNTLRNTSIIPNSISPSNNDLYALFALFAIVLVLCVIPLMCCFKRTKKNKKEAAPRYERELATV